MNVEVNKDYLKAEFENLLIDDPIFDMALRGFLDSRAIAMPAEMFGRLVGEHWLDPEKLLTLEQPAAPTPEWSAAIEISGDRLKMTISHNGEELVYGKSYVQDTDDLGMMRAISYAANMCYKMVQQRSM